MTVAQLKAANKYRDMETSYGILPIPKYDEAQEDYRCLRSYTYVLGAYRRQIPIWTRRLSLWTPSPTAATPT